MTQKKTDRPTSEKQKAANKRNAQRSTGPRTKAGNDRSRLNATKSGAFLNVAYAITSGPFAEDTDVLGDELDEIVDSLQPRDAVERSQALAVARQYVKVARLDRWGAHLLGDDRHLPESTPVVELNMQENLEFARHATVALEAMRKARPSAGDFELGCRLIVSLNIDPADSQVIPGVWAPADPPSTRDQWASTYRSLLHHFHHGEEDRFFQRAEERIARCSQIVAGQRLAIANAAADSILGDDMDRLTRYEARIGRELQRAIDIYEQLQKRTLPEQVDVDQDEGAAA